LRPVRARVKQLEDQVSKTAFEPKIEEKRWSPKIEPEIFKKWEEEAQPFNSDSDLPVFVIDTPPPYPSGRPWHIGAAAHYSQIDMIARTAAMSGHNVLFPIGIDRNGLPVELYTEKKYKVRIHETPREKFLELCRHALDDLEAEMIQIMKTMGLSGDLKQYYRTDSEEYRRLTQTTFITLWKSGLVYQASRPNNYCVDCGTTIADAEVTYEDIPTELVYLRFKVEEFGEDIVVATTRPELLCACQTVIVNPEDERYLKYQDQMVTVPLYGRKVLIQPHPSAKPEFGSGAVMVCSYGDYTDVLLFREMGLKEIVAINDRGRLTEAAGKYQGLRVKKARGEIVKDLEAAGLVVKRESISHRTPMCERSHTPIEIIPMNEYYLKQLEFKPKIREIAEKMIFHPEVHRRILLNWIDSVSIDWPISRRRYYATEIPIWYCDSCGEPQVPEPGKYYQPWKDPAPFKQCSKCGGTSFTGDTRTFDTWMDSSVTPLFVTRYMDDKEFFSKTYPTSLRPQAKDIVRTWLYYTILRCHQLTGKQPFQHAWIMGYGVDEKGERMSKSKGNVIDPIPILTKYGGDTFRYWSASETSLGADFRCSEPRIAGCNKFLTKLWNTTRFVSSFPVPEEPSDLTPSDRWILAELSKLITECMAGYRDFNFFIPANRVREFAWNIFAANYIEMAKSRAYGSGVTEAEQKAAWYTLHTVLRSIMLLLAPIVPFVTDTLWRELYGGTSIHRERFPTSKWDTETTKYTEKIVEFNAKVWFEKKSKGLSLKEPIKMSVPEDLRDFALDLKAMHNLEE
jgi:valyl-tRNA synthetase